MRKFTLIFALAVALMTAIPLQAQTTTYQTSLSSAVSSGGATTVVVASTSNMNASTQTQTYNMVIENEIMKILAISGTTITVQRGQGGSSATPHPSGSIVFHGPAGGSANGIPVPFGTVDPTQYTGTACTSTQYAFTLLVNYRTGYVWKCANSRWVGRSYVNWGDGGGVTGTTSGAFTLTVADYHLQYTTLTGASTVTLPTPVAGMRGLEYVIKNGSTIATNTIWITAGSIDGSAASVAVYGTTGGTQTGGTIRLYSDGSAWFTW